MRRYSTPEFSELDVLVDQVEMMREELLRLRDQAGQEQQFTNAYSSRRYSQTSNSHEQDQPEEYTVHTPSPASPTRVPVMQPPMPRSAATSPAGPSTRRSSYADALIRGHDSADRNAAEAHGAVATGTSQQHSINQMPRFAQPTEATTRRADATLRKQTIPVMSTINEKTSTTSITGRAKSSSPQVSRLPKRMSLPGSWISPSSSDAAKAPATIAESITQATGQSSSEVPVQKKEKSPAYMSPTKATMRRENEILQINPAQKKASKNKKRLVTSKLDTDSTALALAEVNAMSRKLSKALELPEPPRLVASAVTRRRTSNSDILAPIFKKLDRQGLLKDESTLPEQPVHAHVSSSASSSKKSYADVLRPSTGSALPAMRGQTSAEIGKALQAQAQHSTSKAQEVLEPVVMKCFDSGAEQARVIIPSSSTFAVLDEPESASHGEAQTAPSKTCAPALSDDEFPPIPSMAAQAVTDATTVGTPRQGARSLSVDAIQQCNASDTLRSVSSRLNATAASFIPQATLFSAPLPSVHPARAANPVSALPALVARGALHDDVFKLLPYQEWDSLTKDEQNQAKQLRREKMQEYHAPLAWCKNRMVRSWAKEQQSQTLPVSDNAVTDSSPTHSTWSADEQRQGWSISGANGGPSWSGGKGREIQFHREGPDAERSPEGQYVYNNRDTGRSLRVSRPRRKQPAPRDWVRELDDLNRLQSAIRRGFGTVPCSNYDIPEEWCVVPVPCTACCEEDFARAEAAEEDDCYSD